MQDLIILNRNSNFVFIQKDNKIYEDSFDNFIIDYGGLPKIEYTPNGHLITLSEDVIQIDYNKATENCWLNGYAFQTYPNEVCETILNNIDTIIAAKKEREYVEQEPPTQEELNEAEADKTKAFLQNLAVSAMMMSLAGSPTTSQTEEYKTVIKGVSDDVALFIPEVYPVWSGNGVKYKKDMRVTYNSILYKVLQNHTSQEGWTPTSAPSLFAKVLTSEGEILDWEQPDSTNPYMKGDKVRYNGKVYESLIDNNVWAPDAYPLGWKEIEEA